MELRHASVEVDDSVGISGGVDALLLVKVVGFPIGELCALGDALAEEIGPKFLEAHIFDAHTCGEGLEVDVSCRMECLAAMGEHAEVVVKREADLKNCGIFEQFDEARGEAHEVETEEETDTVACYLEEGHLILYTALERGAGLGVYAKNLERAQVFDGATCLALALYHNDASAEGVSRKRRDEVLVGFCKEFGHFIYDFTIYYLRLQSVSCE